MKLVDLRKILQALDIELCKHLIFNIVVINLYIKYSLFYCYWIVVLLFPPFFLEFWNTWCIPLVLELIKTLIV